MALFTEYSLPISPKTLYFGFAFDGTNYYFSTADKQILVLDDTYVQVNVCAARRFYYSLCYDPGAGCFWGAAYGCPGILYQISTSFEEVNRIQLKSMNGAIDVVGGLSYDCYHNRLLFVCKNQFYASDRQGNVVLLADRRVFGETILGICAIPEGLVYLTRQQCCSHLFFVSHNCGKVLERYVLPADYQTQALLICPDYRGQGGYTLQVYSLKQNYCPCLLTLTKEPELCAQRPNPDPSECGQNCPPPRPNPGPCECGQNCPPQKPNSGPCDCGQNCPPQKPNPGPCDCGQNCPPQKPSPGPCGCNQNGGASTESNLINLLMGGLLSELAHTQGQQKPPCDCNNHGPFPGQGQPCPCPPPHHPPEGPCQEPPFPGFGFGMPPFGPGWPEAQPCGPGGPGMNPCGPGCPCMNPCGPECPCMNPCGCMNPCSPGCGCPSCCSGHGQTNCRDAYAKTLESIALAEASLAHILNAEGEKLQKVIAADYDFPELIQVNTSVQKTITDATYLEQVLTNKLEALLKNPPCGECDRTCHCPCPCPFCQDGMDFPNCGCCMDFCQGDHWPFSDEEATMQEEDDLAEEELLDDLEADGLAEEAR